MDASDVAGMSPKLHFGQDHNRSCGKAPPQIVGCAACNLNWSFHDLSKWQAWEQLGLIYEKEQAYKDAKTGSSLSWHGHLPHLTKLSWLWISWSRMLLLIMRKPGSSAMRLLLLWAGTLVLDSYDHRRSYGCKAEAIAWPSTTWKQNAS